MDWLRKMLGADAWSGMDRRQSLRAPCRFEIQVSGSQFSFLAKTKDIGPTGLRLEASGAFPSFLKRGTEVRVKHLNAPFDCEKDTVQAKIVWVKRKNAGLFQCACSFQEEVEVLKRSWVRSVLVKALRQTPQQKRKHLRVRTDWLVPAFLQDKVVEVRVRDLSLAGARFETPEEICERDSIALRLKDLKVACEVRRVAKMGGVFLVGVRFDEQAQNSKYLRELVKKLSGL